MKNKKVTIAIISVIALVLVIIGITYAYWLVTETQERENIITTGCLDITLNGEANEITLENQFPLSDEDGLKLTPYEFTITNNCNTEVDYQINLESFDTANLEEISKDALKVAIYNEGTEASSVTPALLSSYEETTPMVENAISANKLLLDTLGEAGSEDASSSYNLLLWIDKDAPISEMKKGFTSKISVTVGQGIEYFDPYQEGSLAYAIASEYGGFDNINELTDFKALTHGLYKAEDDYGVSYYFRGTDVNNYVSLRKVYDEGFSGVCIYGSCYFDNEEGKYTVDYSTKEECIADIENGAPWTADACVEVSLEGAYVNEYWKIIRINGDGTIRLIYSGIQERFGGGTYKHQIGESLFNPTTVDKSIWGKYTYEENGTQKDSTMKTFLESWYENNLEANYNDIIADSIFCNDRELGYRSGDNQYFAVYSRIRDAASPQLTCTNKSDRYTVLDESIGNGLLKHPIGLITADEAFMAGVGFNGSNYQNNSYLTGMVTVTMSQAVISSNWPGMMHVEGNWMVNVQDKGVKKVIPVINLKAEVKFIGNGSYETPYEIVTE